MIGALTLESRISIPRNISIIVINTLIDKNLYFSDLSWSWRLYRDPVVAFWWLSYVVKHFLRLQQQNSSSKSRLFANVKCSVVYFTSYSEVYHTTIEYQCSEIFWPRYWRTAVINKSFLGWDIHFHRKIKTIYF